jgi:hypothetical protein
MTIKTDMFMSIEKFPYIIIEDEYKDEYINLLNNNSYLVLNDENYFLLTGQLLRKKYGIAIRGVYSNLGGSFSVVRNIENEYIVMYIVGGITSSYNKTILIVETDSLPVKIYICLGGGGA